MYANSDGFNWYTWIMEETEEKAEAEEEKE